VTLFHHRPRLVTVGQQRLGDLSGEIFVNLDPYAHLGIYAESGT
jgi:hypothetical protein